MTPTGLSLIKEMCASISLLLFAGGLLTLLSALAGG